MYEILKDNAGQEAADNFKKDPFWLHPAISIEMARAVRAEKEISRYKKENDDLKEKLKEAPKTALNRIKKIGNNAGTSVEDGEHRAPKDKYSELSTLPGLMSMEELNNFGK